MKEISCLDLEPSAECWGVFSVIISTRHQVQGLLGGPAVDHFPLQGTWVWSLVEEVRSRKPWGNSACAPQRAGTAQKKKKNRHQVQLNSDLCSSVWFFFLNKIRKLFLWTKRDKNAVSFVNLDISEPFVKPHRRYLIISLVLIGITPCSSSALLLAPSQWLTGQQGAHVSVGTYIFTIFAHYLRVFFHLLLILGSYRKSC